MKSIKQIRKQDRAPHLHPTNEDITGPTRMQIQKTLDVSPGSTLRAKLNHTEKAHNIKDLQVHTVTSSSGAQHHTVTGYNPINRSDVHLGEETIAEEHDSYNCRACAHLMKQGKTRGVAITHALKYPHIHGSYSTTPKGNTIKKQTANEEKLVSKGKTATGQKATTVDVEPQLKLQKKRFGAYRKMPKTRIKK
ncbi:MAG: hypothetical protein ACREQ5_05220 [Candidatus Dormibacteria bacterium]